MYAREELALQVVTALAERRHSLLPLYRGLAQEDAD